MKMTFDNVGPLAVDLEVFIHFWDVLTNSFLTSPQKISNSCNCFVVSVYISTCIVDKKKKRIYTHIYSAYA